MMDDFFKRLLLVAAYWIGAMCLIYLVMATDPGYQHNWLFILTGQIVGVIGFILKIAVFIALAVGGFYLVTFVIQIHSSWGRTTK